jgi:hypothetical protein
MISSVRPSYNIWKPTRVMFSKLGDLRYQFAEADCSVPDLQMTLLARVLRQLSDHLTLRL